jgi:hypothetical protein
MIKGVFTYLFPMSSLLGLPALDSWRRLASPRSENEAMEANSIAHTKDNTHENSRNTVNS